MTAHWRWALGQITRRVWFRASLFSVLAVVTACLGIWLSPFIPADIPAQIGSDAVDNILGIIASSMLTVTTFSLSTMVAAYSAATSNVTPRATKLIMEDSTTQTVLSTFIGSFLFSLVGIIVLSTGAYGDRGRVVLFAVTILVVVFIVVTLLRWIDHLSRLGRVTETTQRVEAVAIAALRRRRDAPYLGGRARADGGAAPSERGREIAAGDIGYIQHVDMTALSAIAERGGGEIRLDAIPGTFVDPTRALATSYGLSGEDDAQRIRACFTIGDVRSYDQDPRFGLSVLTEIASRALSQSINDPGTAIDVIGRALRALAVWAEPPSRDVELAYSRIHVPAITVADLFEDVFGPLSRDGAALLEVGIRLQKTCLTLARLGREDFAVEARRHSRLSLARAEAALVLDEDKAVLRSLAAEVAATQR
ncbi:hypothetical protein ASG43_04400 [Aureimonas sp. Leaf454]|uniref:DUF2254 domain-containing protein n=1 Tax=Aureimonas sp. Leaf454 TaxID=1736381 RepID=UPI0006F82527|nr:DUF2254 domain-containing protein [Aureimonas sp. Leaf454]KQT54803.1 hypothetical protein ASG43_04400 [Aureimonas sp. Leaf454]